SSALSLGLVAPGLRLRRAQGSRRPRGMRALTLCGWAPSGRFFLRRALGGGGPFDPWARLSRDPRRLPAESIHVLAWASRGFSEPRTVLLGVEPRQTRRSRRRELIASISITMATVTSSTVEAAGESIIRREVWR